MQEITDMDFLTGDKMETAENIARSCNLFYSDMPLNSLNFLP